MQIWYLYAILYKIFPKLTYAIFISTIHELVFITFNSKKWVVNRNQIKELSTEDTLSASFLIFESKCKEIFNRIAI